MRSRTGFTIIELLVVIVIGSTLVGMALAGFQNAQAAYRARNAQSMYATLHQRARARAVEMGQTVLFFVDTVGDSAFIFSNGQITDVTRFRAQMQVDLRASPAAFLICMTPRGYADPDCPAFGFSTTSTPVRLEFWMNADSSSVTILPMGQLIGL